MKTFTKRHQFLHALIRTRRVSFQVLCHKDWISAWNCDQQLRFILINKFFTHCLIPAANCSIHHIWKWTDPSQPSDQFGHSPRCSSRIFHSSEPILLSSRSSGYFSKFSNLSHASRLSYHFSNFSHPSRSSVYFTNFSKFPIKGVVNWFIQFTTPEISGIFSSIPTENFSDLRTLSFVHLVERIQRRNLYVVIDMTWHENGPWPILSLSPLAGYTRDLADRKMTMYSELLARVSLSSSTCEVVLNLLSLILSYQYGYLSLCSLRVGFPWCHRQMRPHVESPPAHHLRSLAPLARPCTSHNSSSLSFFHSLCLSDSVSARTPPCLSRQGSLNECSDSFSAFVIMRFSSLFRLLLCQLWLSSSTSIPEPLFATECHTSHPRSPIPKRRSVSVVSNFWLEQLHSWWCAKLFLFCHDGLQRFLESCDLQMNWHCVNPILRNHTFSPNCAIGFLQLRPLLIISLVFPSLPILILFTTCAAKRGNQLSTL